jgi:hypothetical protein
VEFQNSLQHIHVMREVWVKLSCFSSISAQFLRLTILPLGDNLRVPQGTHRQQIDQEDLVWWQRCPLRSEVQAGLAVRSPDEKNDIRLIEFG